MELCLITPAHFVDYTRYLSGRFCIAPVALKYPEYKEFFLESAQLGYEIVLDNGAFEGEVIADAQLHDLACEMSAKIVIAPDLYGESTVGSYEESLKYAGYAQSQKAPYQLMMVLQSAPISGFLAREAFWGQVDNMKDGDTEFSWWGIPRILCHNLYARDTGVMEQEYLRLMFHMQACEMGLFKDTKRKFHLLGIGDHVHMIENFWWASRADTASFFWQSACGNQMDEGILHTRVARPKDYFDITGSRKEVQENENFNSTLYHNCFQAQEIATRAKERRRTVTGNLY